MHKNPIGYTRDISTRPQCSVPGCSKLAVNHSTKRGFYYWRRAHWIQAKYPEADGCWCCATHHSQATAERNGTKSARHLTAARSGMTITQYNNQCHPYLRYRKDYCENVDGRLGFKCTVNLPTVEQIAAAGLDWLPIQFLEVDHIDGNHTHNDPSNLQTLCKCCHMIKSAQSGDHLTPGRKTRKLLA